jgi:hypothetical protein
VFEVNISSSGNISTVFFNEILFIQENYRAICDGPIYSGPLYENMPDFDEMSLWSVGIQTEWFLKWLLPSVGVKQLESS